MNTPDRAQFAKFAQEFSGFQEAVTNAFLNEKMKLSTSGQYRTDAQIYYKIATGTDTQGIPTSSGTVSDLDFTTSPEPIQGNNYYKITRTEVEGLKPQEMFSAAGGNLYITDKGEVFVQPGYLVEENGTSRCYVNASKYYIGEGVEVSGGGGSNPEEVLEVNEEDLAKLYAYFVTHSDAIIETENGFDNNDYLDDADTIVISGYNVGTVSLEPPYLQFMFIYYNENYYKVVLEYNESTDSLFPSNVEAMVYSSSLPESNRMYQYFVVLQLPGNYDNENICASVPPIPDAAENLQIIDSWDMQGNKERIVCLYHDNYYGVTNDKSTNHFESVTSLSSLIEMLEFGYYPESAETVYNNFDSENHISTEIILYENNYYKSIYNLELDEVTVTLMTEEEYLALVLEVDGEKLYDFFVTYGDQVNRTENGFESNYHLNDANTIEIVGASLRLTVDETSWIYILYHGTYYKITYQNNWEWAIANNVEPIVYTESMSNTQKMYEYFVTLQKPSSIEDSSVCVNVPPILDAEDNLVLVESREEGTNYEYWNYKYYYLYQGTYYYVNKKTYKMYTPYDHYESVTPMTTAQKMFECGFIPDSAELVGEWTDFVVYSYGGKHYMVNNDGTVQVMPFYIIISTNEDSSQFFLEEIAFNSETGNAGYQLDILSSYDPILTITENNTEQVIDLKSCIVDGMIDLNLSSILENPPSEEVTIRLTVNGQEVTWTGKVFYTYVI